MRSNVVWDAYWAVAPKGVKTYFQHDARARVPPKCVENGKITYLQMLLTGRLEEGPPVGGGTTHMRFHQRDVELWRVVDFAGECCCL